ncbi:hypothetical protein [Cloacibacterium sp. TD35]|uniref:hypothetical protein n=1 Tax=Cloacibacterium sp. TD35 TaxID=2976818 RepID=UPI00237EC356|nr:hypothetical protein [Cloacibacterium sp. TD35]WDT68243.1 hypothetical protein N7277_01160 [Cloacibacterium sp. TD35]
MKKLEISQMENLQGGKRPKCTYVYAGFLAAASALAGGAGIFIFGVGMLLCE